MKTVIIIVSYKNEELTSRYVNKEIIKCRNIDNVIIVNNAATIKSNKIMNDNISNSEIFYNSTYMGSKIIIIPNENNLGFAKANNLGVKFAIKYLKPDFLLFSNDDILLNDNTVVEKLRIKLLSDSRIGCIGPMISGIDGQQQGPYPYRSLWFRYILPTCLPIPAIKISRYIDNLYFKNAKEGFHYVVLGCFFMIRASYFVESGMMDERTFLYREEEILAERLKKIGKFNYWLPSAKIIHVGGQTTKNYRTLACAAVEQSDICYYYNYRNYPLFIIKTAIGLKHIRNKLVNIFR
jgi:GT2 family glycosyltransferase